MSASAPKGDASAAAASAREPTRALPENPDLRHLRDEARGLHRSGATPTLARALFQVARSYGFASWPKLNAHVESHHEAGRLKAAIDRNDLDEVRALMTHNPALHRAPIGYGHDGPLTWVAECRVPRVPPPPLRLAMAEWMIENGSDVHQGGDGPLMRAAISDDRIPMMELLVRHGADVNALWHGVYPIVLAPCECYAAASLRWLLEHGATLRFDPQYGDPVGMVVGIYSRDAAGKHGCLDILAQAGCEMPDTAVIALHRGRKDLLEHHLSRNPELVARHFSRADIFPSEVGLHPESGMAFTPLEGSTLLHMAVEFDDLETAAWLLDHGADPNARTTVDTNGFGGHTPLFHSMICPGGRDDAKARLLLSRGADPSLRATIREEIVGDPEEAIPREYHNVTAAEYARQYEPPSFVSWDAVALLESALA